MAMLIRCSCFLSRPCSRRFPPADPVSGKPCLPGKLGSLLYKVEKHVPSFRGANVGVEIHQQLPGSWTSQPRLQYRNSEDNWVISHLSPVDDELLEWLLSLQGYMRLKFPLMAFFVTNTLMFTTPSQALAETCEADNSFFNMPLLLIVALIGATVGGLLARQRRGELQRVNEQLRQINAALRRQAKIESYAPSLSYAPVGGRITDNEVIVDPRKEELISRLKAGKNFLRNQDPEKAFAEFKAALELAQNIQDPIEEKKAARGLGASLQRQGKYREAIKYHLLVLDVSEREKEESGNTEAYGAIADCYTELGDFEKAGQFYDKYIDRLEKD
ncbi:hypothetical protein SLA2020_322460 [Shorea laevis]